MSSTDNIHTGETAEESAPDVPDASCASQDSVANATQDSVANASSPVISNAVRVRGIIAGIAAGASYGLNPLFGIPLMRDGMSIPSVLFYRYLFAAISLGIWLLIRRQTFKIDCPQTSRLAIMGLLYAASSITLFGSYDYIPSGIGTTLVFLYPVMVALIMVFLKVYPSWQTWVAIVVTFIGVALLSLPEPGAEYHALGFVLASLSALVYAIFVIILNRSKHVCKLTNSMVTFYALVFGTIVFFIQGLCSGLSGIPDIKSFCMLMGLAVFPTIISTATFSYAARAIGVTQTSVLGVFEPITALFVGIFVFGEPMSVTIIIGLILALSAIVFLTATSRKN